MNRDFTRACICAASLFLMACTRWESYPLPTTPTPALPSSVRVSAPGRGSTVLVAPFVRGDTLYGRSRGNTLGIALNAIERVERPRVDGLRTGATVIGGLAGWIALGLLGGGWE
jgi:hypothetical protein